MKTLSSLSVLMVVVMVLALSAACASETITLQSGNAAVGQLDTLITVRGEDAVVNGISRTGASGVSLQNPHVVAPPAWYAAPATSQWVGPMSDASNAPAGSYIYEIEFFLPELYTDASLSLQGLSDNGGDVLLNGSVLQSNGPVGCTGFDWVESYFCDTQSLFLPGRNLLSFNIYNSEGPSGLAFHSTVEYSPVVPEPSSLLGLMGGIGGLGLLWRRRR